MIAGAERKVLVLAPHPDDETLGCGGTIKLISSAGGLVDVLYLTRGELGLSPGTLATAATRREMAAIRTAEAEAACGVLGVRNVNFLGGTDGRLAREPHLMADIVRALESTEYRSVFCPWAMDGHDDHRATFHLLKEAARRVASEFDVWLYEVWTPLEPNMTISIDSTFEAKMAAVRAYESQLAILDYKSAFESLARYRSLRCPPARYVEAFYNCDRSMLAANTSFPWALQPAGDAAR